MKAPSLPAVQRASRPAISRAAPLMRWFAAAWLVMAMVTRRATLTSLVVDPGEVASRLRRRARRKRMKAPRLPAVQSASRPATSRSARLMGKFAAAWLVMAMVTPYPTLPTLDLDLVEVENRSVVVMRRRFATGLIVELLGDGKLFAVAEVTGGT